MSAISADLTAALADRYRIERELGQGGMATVYLALDLKHHRQVAVRVLRPERRPGARGRGRRRARDGRHDAERDLVTADSNPLALAQTA